MKVAQTLSLLFAPVAFAQCGPIDLMRVAPYNVSVSNYYPAPLFDPTNATSMTNFWMSDSDGYGLLGILFSGMANMGGMCGGVPITSQASIIADGGGDAIACFYDSDNTCPFYRGMAGTGATNCSTLPLPYPGEICYKLPGCSDLYTTTGGLGAISVKWDTANQVTMHQGFGCSGTLLSTASFTNQGDCVKMFAPQQFYMKVYNAGGRNFQPYTCNMLQMLLNGAVCSNYPQAQCPNCTTANFITPYLSCVSQGQCPNAVNDYPANALPSCPSPTPPSPSPSPSPSSPASSVLASFAAVLLVLLF